jgi:hypothetical protein
MKKVKERKDDVEARSNYKIDQRLFIAKSICITTNSRLLDYPVRNSGLTSKNSPLPYESFSQLKGGPGFLSRGRGEA